MDKINRQFSADDILKVLKRLSGGIYPSGDASADEVSNENLDVYCDIFYQMYREIKDIANYSEHRGQSSILIANNIAKETLNSMKQYD